MCFNSNKEAPRENPGEEKITGATPRAWMLNFNALAAYLHELL